MDLVIKCELSKVKNKVIKNFNKVIVIKKVRFREKINKNTLVEYFYKKFTGVYLKNIIELNYKLT